MLVEYFCHKDQSEERYVYYEKFMQSKDLPVSWKRFRVYVLEETGWNLNIVRTIVLQLNDDYIIIIIQSSERNVHDIFVNRIAYSEKTKLWIIPIICELSTMSYNALL